ncbi:sigma-70 family RNA polymerase sigma factor [Agriterribacter sp.]|uniref:RNA polymerase sigma factor n=1 Tax=Agriterribacter sp. TaxID=2821509 RepID=UPI002BF4E838|nr:sigma-70 family RNA polymerase sigma factor [Agriterribacter sp.]HTN08442.1 sigma-70 family RNA polymerase sigma factor [Agriterribacter sp.]
MSSNLKEQALIRGLSVNDKNAIETIYSDHYGIIQNLVLNNNGSEEDAKDVFQEALIVLYEKSKSAEFELNCQVGTYLYAVSKRLWLKRLQKSSRYELQSNGFEETIYVEDDIGIHEKRNKEFGMMEFAMTNIGEPCKSILEAYYIQKQNMQEIAELFGYTNSENAKNQKYKCLVRLRKLFFAQYKNGNK